MPNYNKVVLIGNLTDDPQQNQSGTYFSVAVNEKWVENGDKKSDTLFIDVVAQSKTAELIMNQFAKGDPILVEGKLRLRKKTSHDRRFRHEIALSRFEVIRNGYQNGGAF
jgi:single-strand DNA-binding protein